MNINLLPQNTNNTALGSNHSLVKQNLKVEDKDLELPQNKIEVGVAIEIGKKEFYETAEEIFELRNKNRTWTVNGEGVAYKDMDNDTKKFLFEFEKIHKQYRSETSGKETQHDFSFQELIKKLGNEYANMRNSLKENLTDEMFNSKLEKLDNAFKMYTETKVIGNKYEVGSMVNRAHFAFEQAKSRQYLIEMRKKVNEGERYITVKPKDITENDDETIKNLMKSAMQVLNKTAEYFKAGNSAINTDEEYKKFNDFTSINSSGASWSLDKLSDTFKLLDKISESNEEKYTSDEYEKFFEDNGQFTNSEKDIFDKLFEINDTVLD